MERASIIRTMTLVAALGAAGAGAVSVLAAGLPDTSPSPKGWFAAGTRPQDYVMGLDPAITDAGKPSARILATAPNPAGFGTLMQSISADSYRGKRVRFSGDIRVDHVTSWASLWMRVDGACMQVLAFDNAQQRAAHGTADWTAQSIVLDVPTEAAGISFGTLLAAGGEVWVSHLKLEPVSKNVATTDVMPTAPSRSCGPPSPINLDFSATGAGELKL